jgi:hypothetical protein
MALVGFIVNPIAGTSVSRTPTTWRLKPDGGWPSRALAPEP